MAKSYCDHEEGHTNNNLEVNQNEKSNLSDEKNVINTDCLLEMKELSNAINKLKNKKSAGFNCIKNEMLKFGFPFVNQTILKLFNSVYLDLVIFLRYGKLALLHHCLKEETQIYMKIIVVFLFVVV